MLLPLLERRLVLIVVMLLLSPTQSSWAQTFLEGVVATESDMLNIRSGPGTQHPVIAKIAKGESLFIIEQGEEWHHVRLQDGNSGYTSSQYVHILPGYRLVRHRAAFLKMGMSVDAVYQQYQEDLIRLIDLRLEGMFTPALAVYMNHNSPQTPSLIGEIGWQNGWIISRITIYDNQFKTDCGIGVGATIGELKRCYTLDWADFGEGTLYIRVKELGMSFGVQADIPERWNETRDPDLLPEEAPIQLILIN